MKPVRNLLILLLLALLTTLTVFACSSSGAIKVGSKDFTEEFILGELYALVLENSGLKVERKLNCDRSLWQKALQWPNKTAVLQTCWC